MLAVLREIWTRNPDLRLGQLILNLDVPDSRDVYYMEDTVLEAELMIMYNDVRATWPKEEL